MPITFAFNQSLGSCPNASDFLRIAPRIGALREGSRDRWHDYSTLKCARTTASHIRHRFNDRIATQRYSSPEIPIGSRVMSRTTSALIGRRSRKMVANVAGCRSFCTFRDFHTSIAFTPVGPQPNLAHIFGWIWD